MTPMGKIALSRPQLVQNTPEPKTVLLFCGSLISARLVRCGLFHKAIPETYVPSLTTSPKL